MSHNIAELYSFAQGNPETLPEGILDADLTVEIATKSDALLDLFIAGTEFATTLKFTRVASDDDLLITIPKAKIFDIGEPFEVEGEFIKTTATVTIIEAETITATINDDVATY